MFTNILTLTALATAASAFTCTGNYFSFYNRGGDAMSYQRVDPVLNPGLTKSSHLHAFDGANVVSPSTEFADLQSATCTTARIKPDKSIYWRPVLMWNGNGTGFYRVQELATKIYYKFGDANAWANVTAFPDDFKMFVGYPMKRSEGGDNSAGVRWGCHEPDGASNPIFTPGFPKGFSSCNYGFASEVTYPSCWDGTKFDPKNPYQHMAYPLGNGQTGIDNCPTTHRAARFPTIFIEYWWDISAFTGHYGPNDSPWVLANGDPTGLSFHADFENGWDSTVLNNAIAEVGGCNCGCGCGQTEMEQCFGKANVNSDDDASWKQCNVPGDADETARVMQTLPGCNPIQSGPASATAVTGAGCAATAMPAPSGYQSSAAGSSAAATKTAAVSSGAVPDSAKTSSKAAVSSAAAPDSAKTISKAAAGSSVAADAVSTGILSMSFPNKHISSAYGASGVKAAANPTANPTAAATSQQYGDASAASSSGTASGIPSNYAASSVGLPSMSLATPVVPAGSTTVPAGSTGVSSGSSPAGTPAGDDCPVPVYVTITPTVYVTAAANSTSCFPPTVTQTLTQTATITIPAASGMGYGSY